MVKRMHKLMGMLALAAAATDAFTTTGPTGVTRTRKSSFSLSVSTIAPERVVVSEKSKGGSLQQSKEQLDVPKQQQQQQMDFNLIPVLSAACLITSNTVGAGMLVLPELTQGVGMETSLVLFGVAHFLNLLSGLMIADVAIQQREQEAASFKDVCATILPNAATAISAVSIGVNMCVAAFDVSRAGTVLNSQLSGDAGLWSIGWAVVFASLLLTEHVSAVAAVLATGLFGSFAALLLQPTDTIVMTANTAVDAWMPAVCHLFPIIFMSLVYQNVVPAVVKLLQYHRTNVVSALVLGSSLPLLMYVVWCCHGTTTATGGLLMTLFSVSTLAGSTLGTGVSIAGELKTVLSKDKESGSNGISTAAVAMGIPLLLALLYPGDLTEALSLAGSFGSPVLYGLVPVAMTWKQQQQKESSLVPAAALPVLGGMSVAFIGQEALQRISEVVI